MARKKRRLEVRRLVEVHLVPEPGSGVWVHTHGLAAHGHPELEILGVPSYFVEAAGSLLNTVGDYVLNERPVKAGERMQLGPLAFVRFEEAKVRPGAENHYEDPVLRLVDSAGMVCGDCGEGPAASGHLH